MMRNLRRGGSLTCVALGALLTASCGMDGHERALVRQWLECYECRTANLDSVVAHAGLPVQCALIRALRGPDERLQRAKVRSWRAAYRTVAQERGVPPDSAAEVAYARRHLDAFFEAYQLRAAMALGAINTWLTRSALRIAMRYASQYPVAVAREISTQRADSLIAVPGYQGPWSLPPSDSVTPPPRVRAYCGNTPCRGVGVRFGIVEGRGRLRDMHTVTDANGDASVGAWWVGGALGTNRLIATIPRDTVAFVATAIQ